LTASLRRRADNALLRWQARLDSAGVDRVLPWAVAAGLFILLAILALPQARSLDGGTDLATATQAAWLIRDGRPPFVTIDGGGDYFANQAAFAFYPVVALTHLVPIVPTLLLVQSAVLAVAVVPIWKICRARANLRVGAAATVVLVYALYPVVHNLNLHGFHPGVLALPALLGMAYFGLGGRWRPAAACILVVLLARADLGLAVAGFGVLLVVEGRRRAGAVTALVGLGWTLLAALAIQPTLGDGNFPHLEAFAAYGDTPASVTWGMITDPLGVLGDIVAEVNFDLLVTLLAPVVFLPLLAPRYLLPVVPLQLMYLVADLPLEDRFGQQTVAVTAFIFLATAFALARIGRHGVDKITVDRRVLAALVLAGTVFFIRDAASSPYREPWGWGGRDAADGVRIAIDDTIPPEAAVRASPSMLQLLADRPEVFTLDGEGPVDPAGATEDVDFVVVDRRDTDWTAAQTRILRSGLERAGFEVVVEGQDITLYAREGVPRRETG
jgi:uncharacterized membrane protein